MLVLAKLPSSGVIKIQRQCTNWYCREVRRRMLSSSAKCPTSIILSASSRTRKSRDFTSFASSPSYRRIRNVSPERGTLRTSCIMSQSRPGVATSTSTPRDSIRFCLWGDIPPTMVATLTRGGGFGTFGLFQVTRSSGTSTSFRQAFK